MPIHLSARRCTAPAAITVAALLWLSGCSGGDSGNGVGPAPPIVPPVAGPVPAPVPPQPTGPLTGDAAGLAKTAIQTVDVGDTYAQAEVSTDADGRRIVRTKIEILLHDSATVGQANALLNELEARITTSMAGQRWVVVRIPDPGTLDALEAIVARVEAKPYVWFVRRAVFPATNELPGNIEPDALDTDRIRHHLAVGAAGAWSARNAIVDFPRVMIWDYFGDGPPDIELDYNYVGSAATDFATGLPHFHGYHVAGIVAGRFGGRPTPRGRVTGMMPGLVQLSVVDDQKADPLDGQARLLIQLASVAAGTVIVNTSIGWNCDTDTTCLAEAEVREEAVSWIEKVRSAGLESRFLHVSAAGNVDELAARHGVREARYSWFTGAAALLTDLLDSAGNPVAPLTNVLMVENVRPGAFPYSAPRCLSEISFHSGHVGAIGSGVWSFTDAGTQTASLDGTSMAAPQVAGLAAYLLAVRPELTPQDLSRIIRETAAPVPVESEPDCSSAAEPAPVIQPYEALLALDQPDGGIVQMPVRLALLDIDDNGTYTDSDLTAFLATWETAAGAADFGRGDLNNDRHTGGDGRRPFDLDVNGLHDGRPEAQVMGRNRVFDEAGLTDVAIACYYAYSSLYTGDDAARDLLLQPYRERGDCGEGLPVAVSATFPGIVVPGTAETLELIAVDLDGQPVPALHVAVEAIGGTVSRASGETDGGGRFTTQATLAPGASRITLTATVREAPEGEVIEVLTRSANAAGPGTVRLLRRWDGLSETGLSYFRLVASFGHTAISSAHVFYDLDEDVPASQEDLSNRAASLTARGAGAHDGTSASAEAQGTHTETVHVVDGRFLGIVHSTNFSASVTMTNPPPYPNPNPGSLTHLATANALAGVASCVDFRVEGHDVRYVLELTGSTPQSMHVATRLTPIGGGGRLVDYSVSGASHAVSRDGVLSAGVSYTLCVYLSGGARWDSFRRTQIITETDGQLDVRFTLEPVPPP
jgi:hypothetical protein